jgi:hypothetical protein
MNINRVVSTAVFVLIAMAGCASGPTYDEHASKMAPIPSDKGRLYIYRLTSEVDELRPTVRINGEPTDRAIPLRFFYLDLPAGKYEISISKKTDQILTIDLDTGGELFVRLDLLNAALFWPFIPVLVDADKAREELRKTVYSGDMIATTESPPML